MQGLGALDSILGILFSAVKVLLVLSVLYAWFSALNADFEWVGRETIEESKWFDSVAGISERLTPYFEDLKQVKITVAAMVEEALCGVVMQRHGSSLRGAA